MGAILFGCQPKTQPPRMNLVLILIDTLRADRLACYGHDRPTSPNVDKLAAEGILFENAIAQSSWTLPSAASLLTGLYPTRHQATSRKSVLPEWRVTLAEMLRDAGLETAAIVSHSYVSSEHNLDQGFDFFDESNIGGHLGISSPGVTDAAIRWLGENGRRPFFLFLHYFDPHYAYLEHEGYKFGNAYGGWIEPETGFNLIQARREELGEEDIEYLESCYESEIAFTDHHVGRVLAELERLGLKESTIVVFTADHGEEFMEHGWLGHTQHLYEEIVRVPLILRAPGRSDLPGRYSPPVELTDLMPSVLSMLRVECDTGAMDGRSFLGAVDGVVRADEFAFSEVSFGRTRPPGGGGGGIPGAEHFSLKAVRNAARKCIYDVTTGQWELYDLVSDPGETASLTNGGEGGVGAELKSVLLSWAADKAKIAGAENTSPDTLDVINQDTEERLRALGYIQ